MCKFVGCGCPRNSCSKTEYLFRAFVIDFELNAIGRIMPLLRIVRALPTAVLDASVKRIKIAFFSSQSDMRARIGGLINARFTAWRAFSCSSPHLNSLSFRINFNKGSIKRERRGMKDLKKATMAIKLLISVCDFGAMSFAIVATFDWWWGKAFFRQFKAQKFDLLL